MIRLTCILLFPVWVCACSEPIPLDEQGVSNQEAAVPLETKAKRLSAGMRLIQFDFHQRTSISEKARRSKIQSGQIQSLFKPDGTLGMCGVLRMESKLEGEMDAPPGVPAGVVSDLKLSDEKTAVFMRGYRGTWREEGEWMVGSLDRESAKGSCKGSEKPVSGRRFWCIRLESSPPLPPNTLFCGFEKPPITSAWMSSFMPEELDSSLALPESTVGQNLHWMVMGSQKGMTWEWTPDQGGAPSSFKSEAFDFSPDSFKVNRP